MTLYDELPIEFLNEFYQEIQKKIEQGTLSTYMNIELDLIRKAAAKKGLFILKNQPQMKTRTNKQ